MHHNILNIETINEIKAIDGQGHRKLLALMLTSFLAEVPEKIATLTRDIHEYKSDALLEDAHALKSSSVCIGADALAQLCSELEIAARNKDYPRALQLSTKLLQCFEITKKALQAHL